MKDGFYVEVKPTDPLSKVRRLFREYSPRIALVTEEKGSLIGIIYRSTIISVTSIKTNYVARNLVERPLLVAEKQSNVKSLLREMVYRDEWTVPLVERYTPQGTVSLESFIRWINKNEIGKNELSKTMVKEVMSTGKLKYVSAEDTVHHTIRKLIEEKFAGIPVVDSRARCIGILTHSDILRKGAARIALDSESGPSRSAKVSEIMTSPVTTVTPDRDLWSLIEIMAERGYGRIPVVDKLEKLVGIVDRSDITSYILGVRNP